MKQLGEARAAAKANKNTSKGNSKGNVDGGKAKGKGAAKGKGKGRGRGKKAGLVESPPADNSSSAAASFGLRRMPILDSSSSGSDGDIDSSWSGRPPNDNCAEGTPDTFKTPKHASPRIPRTQTAKAHW